MRGRAGIGLVVAGCLVAELEVAAAAPSPVHPLFCRVHPLMPDVFRLWNREGCR